MINLRPLRGLVLIKRDEPESMYGNIIIPDNCRTYSWRAEVVNVGEGVKGFVKGDQILFLKEFTVLPFKERRIALTNADNIVAKIVVNSDNIEEIYPVNKNVMIKPDQAEKTDGVMIVSKSDRDNSKSGKIVDVGCDCSIADTFIGHRVWYPADKAVKCVEDDKNFVIVEEGEILCVEN